MVNRSATWADWDEEALALELQEIQGLDFDVNLTGFDVPEIENLLDLPIEDEVADAVPDVPDVAISRLGDLWLLGSHRVLCGDATSPEAIARLLNGRQPLLMVVDPPYGICLNTEWCDQAGLNAMRKFDCKAKRAPIRMFFAREAQEMFYAAGDRRNQFLRGRA